MHKRAAYFLRKFFFLVIIFILLMNHRRIVFADAENNILFLNTDQSKSDCEKYQKIVEILQKNNQDYNIILYNMDLKEIDKEKYAVSFSELYSNYDFQFVIANGNEAIRFYNKYKKRLFEESYSIFLQDIYSKNTDIYDIEQSTSLITKYNVSKLLKIINRLHPYKNNIVTILDDKMNNELYNEFNNSIGGYADKKFIFLKNTNIKELQSSVKSFNNDCIVLYLGAIQKSNNEYYYMDEGFKLINKNINTPIYTIFPRFIGNGGVGGERCSYTGEAKIISTNIMLF